MIETVIRKRIEILADQAQVKRVTSVIDQAGITGWTVLPVTSGKGRDGRWREERVMGTDKNLVVTIASLENASTLAELSYRLFDIGIMPYYLHQLDPVQGAGVSTKTSRCSLNAA